MFAVDGTIAADAVGPAAGLRCRVRSTSRRRREAQSGWSSLRAGSFEASGTSPGTRYHIGRVPGRARRGLVRWRAARSLVGPAVAGREEKERRRHGFP